MRRVLKPIWMVTITIGLSGGFALAQNTAPLAGNALVVAIQDNAAIPLATADKDAGLIASALARKNYNVLGVRNLDHANLKAAISEFEERIKSSPSAPVLIYFSGPAVQFTQDNFLLASDSNLVDVKAKAVSLNALTSDLARISSGPKLIVVDGARIPLPATIPANLTTGLSLPERVPNTIILFNNTPGLSILEPAASINAFAIAGFEAIGNGAPSSQDFVDLVILRTFDISKGKQAPWYAGKHDKNDPIFTPVNSQAFSFNLLHSKMVSELNPAQGFAAALLRHSIASYEEYILIHIQNPMTQISRTLLTALREASIWREAAIKPSASSLWAYLKIYPRGPHAAEARAMLVQLGQTPIPPQDAPLLAIATTEPTPNELALLAQTIPYRLDDTIIDLQNVAASIRPLLPDLSAQDQFLSKPIPSASYFGLPIPPIDDVALGRIQLPTQLPSPPAPPLPLDPKPIKKQTKPTIPVPPQRQSDSEPPEQAALITITIPLFGSATPAPAPNANDAPAQVTAPAPKPIAPKPILKKPTSDVFEQTFDSAPAQQSLPY